MAEPSPRKRKRGPYRRYNRDPSIPVPRMTLWHQTKAKSATSTCTGNLSQEHSLSSQTSQPSSPNSSQPSSPNSSQPSSPNSPQPPSPPSSQPPSPNSPQHPSPTRSQSLSPNSPQSPSQIGSDPPSPTSSMDFSWLDSEEELLELTQDVDYSHFSDDLFTPLYKDSTTTRCGAYCAIMHFATTNRLPYTAIEDLLKLLQLLCPQPNLLPTSLYKLKKFFKVFGADYKKSKVCTICLGQFSGPPTCACHQEEKVGHLVHIEVSKSIKTLITNHWDDLKYPQSFQEKEDAVVTDIWSGDALCYDIKPGKFFSFREHLGFSIFTDGIPLFKSSTLSLWPVYLVVNNLPPSIRMRSNNVILCALWCGPGKPPVHHLLEPIMKVMENLLTVGITLQTPNGMKTIRGKLLLGVFDMPAKAIVLNTKQFNGEYGCSTCVHPGLRLPNGARVFHPDSSIELRTNLSMISDAEMAERNGCPERGVKGLSVLANKMDLVDGIPVDYMHAVLEGVTRWLLRAWFDPSKWREPFYIRRFLSDIDTALLSQHPPHEFSRPPRAISTHMKYWKASELRSWLLYYSLPLIQGYLPSLYVHHFSLLVCAMHILLQDYISPTSLAASSEMIQDFVDLLPELYGDESCTANAHALSHIPKFVKLWGPLWTHSAFGFESKNGHLKSLFHGKTSIIDQLVFVTDVIQTLQIVQISLEARENEATLEYISKVTGRAPIVNMALQDESVYSIGKIKPIQLSTEYSTELSLPTSVLTFQRACINGTVYYSKSYLRGQGKRDSTVCSFKDSAGTISFGEIEQFVLAPEPVAIVRVYGRYPQTYLEQAGNPCRNILRVYKNADLLQKHIHAVDKRHFHLCTVNLSCIQKKAILISVPTLTCDYVISQPNKFEYH